MATPRDDYLDALTYGFRSSILKPREMATDWSTFHDQYQQDTADAIRHRMDRANDPIRKMANEFYRELQRRQVINLMGKPMFPVFSENAVDLKAATQPKPQESKKTMDHKFVSNEVEDTEEETTIDITSEFRESCILTFASIDQTRIDDKGYRDYSKLILAERGSYSGYRVSARAMLNVTKLLEDHTRSEDLVHVVKRTIKEAMSNYAHKIERLEKDRSSQIEQYDKAVDEAQSAHDQFKALL